LLANVVYQGHAGGLDVDELWEIGRVATQGLAPDLVLCLDLPDDQAAGRIVRPLDRMEQQPLEFRRRLRQGYLDEARLQRQPIVVIDAAQSIDQIQADIRRAARSVLEQAARAEAR
jgi:dTMP kinase